MLKINSKAPLFILVTLCSAFLFSCSTTKPSPNESLPVLAQDELIRPYIKLGRIQVTRETYGSDYSLSPDITAWGLAAVRHEAEKMGADAIMFPEVTGYSTTHGILPSTEYHATGIAIKFK